MTLKKPSDYFKKNIVTVNSSVNELSKTPELNTFSDAFESFKNNLSKIEVLSEFSDTLDNYRVNIERVNHLSEKVEDIQDEIQNLLKKEDLDRAMMSQLLVVEQSIRDLQSKVKGINEKNLTEIRLDVSGLTQSVNEFLKVEVPQYKRLIVDSELRTDNRFTQLEENVNQTLEGIGEFVDNKYQELTETLQGVNKQSLAGILEDFKILDENFIKLKEQDIPKYKGLIGETKRKTESKLEEFNQILDKTTNSLLEKISEVEGDKTNLIKVVNDKIQEVSSFRDLVKKDIQENEETRNFLKKKINDLEVEIIRNESHIKVQNKNLEQIQENVKSAIEKLNIDELERQNHKLSKKIKYLEEVFEKFSEKEILTENIIIEPPSTNNEDPLTPLDKNYVTLEQLQEHYRIFINRIQQQLTSLGGGGETRLKYLDDIVGIATNPSAYNDKYLKYNHSTQKFEFASVFGGDGAGLLVDLDDIDITNLGNNRYLQYDAASSKFVFSTVSAEGLELIAGNIESGIVTTNSTSPSVIISFSASTYRSAVYQIQVTNGSNYNMTTLNVIHDGSTSYMTEYGAINQPIGVATFSTDINSGSLRLIGYPAFATETTFKVISTVLNT